MSVTRARVILLCILAALVALWLARAPLLGMALRAWLATRDVPVQSLSVTEFGPGQLRLEDISLGRDAELVAKRVRVSYQLLELVRGRVRHIEITGARVSADLRSGDAELGGVEHMIAPSAGDDAEPSSALPSVAIDGGRVRLRLPAGEVTADIDGALDLAGPWPVGTLRIDRLAAMPASGLALPQVHGSFRVTAGEDHIALSGSARSQPGALELDFDARMSGLPAAPELRLELESIAGSALAGWLEPFPLELERLRVQASVDATLSSTMQPASASAWRDLAQPGAWRRISATTEVRASGIGYGDSVSGAQIEGSVTIRSANEGIALHPDLHGRQLVLSPAWLARQQVPQPLRGTLSAPFDVALSGTSGDAPAFTIAGAPEGGIEAGTDLVLTVTGGEESPHIRLAARGAGRLTREFSLASYRLTGFELAVAGMTVPGARVREVTLSGTLQGDGTVHEGELELACALESIEAGNITAGGLAAKAPVRLTFAPGEVAASLRDHGQITLNDVIMPDAGTIPRAGVDLQRAQMKAQHAQGAGWQVSHELEAALPAFELHVDGDMGTVEVEVPGLVSRREGTDDAMEATVSDLAVRAPAIGLSVTAVNATAWPWPPRDARVLRIDSARIDVTDDFIALPPLDLEGEVVRRGSDLALEGRLATAAGDIGARVSAHHDTAGGQGQASLDLEPVRYEPGSLQPGQLVPAFETLRNVSGTLEAQLSARWQQGNLTSAGHVLIDDASFQAAGVTVLGTRLDLALESLLPPRTLPGQSLTVRSIDAGIDLRNLAATFALADGEEPAVALEGAGAELLDGRITVPAVRIPLSGASQAVPVELHALDLSQLLDTLGIEGVAGTGRISGTIPVTFGPDGIAIVDGRVAATGPGELHFQSAAARNVLQGSGEQVRLLLKALENFHYDELSLELNKTAGNDLEALLSVLGNNPEVANGRPFRLNVNLETDLDPLLDAVAQGLVLSSDTLQRLWRRSR